MGQTLPQAGQSASMPRPVSQPRAFVLQFGSPSPSSARTFSPTAGPVIFSVLWGPQNTSDNTLGCFMCIFSFPKMGVRSEAGTHAVFTSPEPAPELM